MRVHKNRGTGKYFSGFLRLLAVVRRSIIHMPRLSTDRLRAASPAPGVIHTGAMPAIMKASTRSDLLAAVPAMLGYTPTDSIVFVAFQGTRSCGAMRFDLPRAGSKAINSRIASTIVGMLCKLPSVDAVVGVIYTTDSFATTVTAPHRELAEVFRRRLEQSGFEIRGLLCQATDGWASYGHPFPAGGHDLAELQALALPASLHNRPPSGDQATAGTVPDADPSAIARFADSLAQLRSLFAVVADAPPMDPESLDPAVDALLDIPRLAETALWWTPSEELANSPLLVLALQGPPNRDLVMLQWATCLDVGDALDAQANGEPMIGDFSEDDLGNLMFGVGPRPNPERILRGIALLSRMLSCTTGLERLPLLTMLAWLNWAVGLGSRAGAFIEQACTLDPDYGMARALAAMFENNPLPEWAFSGPTPRDY
jgi:hypothetical protein